MGTCGFIHPAGGARLTEVGFWIGRAFWGRGYATEALRLLLDFIFQDRKICLVRARTLPENPASCRVLEKVGFAVARELPIVDGKRSRGDAVRHYVLRRAEWKSRNGLTRQGPRRGGATTPAVRDCRVATAGLSCRWRGNIVPEQGAVLAGDQRHGRLVWWQVLLIGLLLYVLGVVFLVLRENPNLFPTVVMLGNFLVPVTYVAFFYQHRHLSQLTMPTTALNFFYGGVLGVFAAALLEPLFIRHLTFATAFVVGLIEEFAKILGVLVIARRRRHDSEFGWADSGRGGRDGLRRPRKQWLCVQGVSAQRRQPVPHRTGDFVAWASFSGRPRYLDGDTGKRLVSREHSRALPHQPQGNGSIPDRRPLARAVGQIAKGYNRTSLLGGRPDHRASHRGGHRLGDSLAAMARGQAPGK